MWNFTLSNFHSREREKENNYTSRPLILQNKNPINKKTSSSNSQSNPNSGFVLVNNVRYKQDQEGIEEYKSFEWARKKFSPKLG